MLLPTGKQMQAVDTEAIEGMGIPSLDLMERAGNGVADAVQTLSERCEGPVVIACGRGNNGGDGLVAARRLAARGENVQVWLATDPEGFSADAKANWDRLTGEGSQLAGSVEIMPVGEGAVDPSALAEAWSRASVIVDALLGTGVTGAPRPPLDGWVTAMNVAGPPIVAVDIPSGVNADTGAVEGVAPLAALTVTMALPKTGQLLYPGREHAGRIQVVDIGIPRAAALSQSINLEMLTHAWASLRLPPRRGDAHKGDCGRVVVVAGSAGMMGAGRLVSAGAYRAGAGLVKHAAPASLLITAHGGADEVIVTPLEDGGSGRLVPQKGSALVEAYDWADSIALGPGLGMAGETAEFVAQALQQSDGGKALVLDADGLNHVADAPERLKEWSGPAVLTPHPGEAARLLDCSIADVVADRIASARTLAARYEAVAVLKGAPTVIAAADERAAICPLGNPGMASGGTGDVLTGVIAGLLAQGLSTYVAAALGVYLHALSGDLAALDIGVWSLMAGDLVRYLPAAFSHVEARPDLDVLAEGIRS